jgi:hypothetical protein
MRQPFGTVWLWPALLATAACSIPDRIEKRGNFQIEYYRSEGFGHTSTRRALYHVKGLSQRTRVTDAAVGFRIVNGDADRIIYETCSDVLGGSRYGDGSPCRHMYFDGHTGKNHVIGGGLKISMSALDDRYRWSPSGRFVALGDQYELVIVDMETGRSIRLGDTLRLEEPYYPEKWQHREVRWGQWSADDTQAAVIVMSPHEAGLPVYVWDEELYSLDAATGAVTLVGSHTGELGAKDERTLWRSGNFTWDGGALQVPR